MRLKAPTPSSRPSFLRLLRTVVDDFVAFAGLPSGYFGRLAGWPLFLAPSLAVASRLAAYEAGIDVQGLPAASLGLLQRYYRGVTGGDGGVPASGPLLVLANHPGLGDAMALFAWLGRRDIVVVTNDRPFFRAMPALARHTITVAAGSTVGAIRLMTEALARGRCLVLFPAGRIEPDLARNPRAAAPLAEWPDLVGALARTARSRARDFAILPVLISDVVARGADRSRLVRWAAPGEARNRAAALYTFVLRASRGQRVRLSAGRLLAASRLVADDRGAATAAARGALLEVADRVRAEARVS
jgi:hypothetical protein